MSVKRELAHCALTQKVTFTLITGVMIIIPNKPCNSEQQSTISKRRTSVFKLNQTGILLNKSNLNVTAFD